MRRLTFFLFCLLCSTTYAQNNKLTAWDSLALTPPMGWNSWNFFEARVSDSIIRQMADAMAANGMRDAGYHYIIIDDYWVGGRDVQNKIYPDPKKFPYGMKALADYVHSKGLKLGIYSDAAPLTCGGVTASYGFEESDAQTFADWGIDYLKYDYCNAPEDVTTAFARYKKMGDALKKTGRPIIYAICEWGPRKPWLWARAAGGHLWRTTWDSRDVWQAYQYKADGVGIIEIFDHQDGLASYAGPGGWNDPDLLMVGLYGKGSSSTVGGRYKGCTDTEYRTHFALWSMLAAPLIVNMDLRSIEEKTLKLLLNKDLLHINQDKLGRQATTIYQANGIQVLAKPLTNQATAICIFNRSDKPNNYKLDWKKDLQLWKTGTVKDIWQQKTGKQASAIAGQLAAHDCAVYIIE